MTMTLDEILSLLDTLSLCDAALWFVEYMSYDAPDRAKVYEYLLDRRKCAALLGDSHERS